MNEPTPETKDRLRAALAAGLGDDPGAVLWPADSEAIPDDTLIFRIAYLGPEWAGLDRAELLRRLDRLHRLRGQTRRQFRNGVAFVVPSAPAISEYAALAPADQARPEAAARIYPVIHLPRDGQAYLGETQFDEIRLDAAGAGPLHARVMTAMNADFRHELSPEELAWTIGLGRRDCAGFQRLIFPMSDLARWFFVFLNLPRLRDTTPLRHTIAAGIRTGEFGLVEQQPLLELDRMPPGLAAQAVTRRGIPESSIRFTPDAYLVWGGALR